MGTCSHKATDRLQVRSTNIYNKVHSAVEIYDFGNGVWFLLRPKGATRFTQPSKSMISGTACGSYNMLWELVPIKQPTGCRCEAQTYIIANLDLALYDIVSVCIDRYHAKSEDVQQLRWSTV